MANVRLSVNMNEETAAAVRKFAETHGISVTETIRKMVSISSFIAEMHEQGKSIQIADPRTGKVREMILLGW